MRIKKSNHRCIFVQFVYSYPSLSSYYSFEIVKKREKKKDREKESERDKAAAEITNF